MPEAKVTIRGTLTEEVATVIDNLQQLGLAEQELQLVKAQVTADPADLTAAQTTLNRLLSISDITHQANETLHELNGVMNQVNVFNVFTHKTRLIEVSSAIFQQLSELVPLLQQSPVVVGPLSANFAELDLQCVSAVAQLRTLEKMPLTIVKKVIALTTTDIANFEYLTALSAEHSTILRDKQAAVEAQLSTWQNDPVVSAQRATSVDIQDLPQAEARAPVWAETVVNDAVAPEEARLSIAVPVSPGAAQNSGWMEETPAELHLFKSAQQCHFLFKLLDQVEPSHTTSVFELLNEMTQYQAPSWDELWQHQEFEYLSNECKTALQAEVDTDAHAYVYECLAQEEQRIVQQQNQPLIENAAKQQAAQASEQKLAAMDPRSALFEQHKRATEQLVSAEAQLAILKRQAAAAERLAETQRQQQALLAQKQQIEKEIHAAVTADFQPKLASLMQPLLEKHHLTDDLQRLRAGEPVDKRWSDAIEGRLWGTLKADLGQQLSTFLEQQASESAHVAVRFNSKSITWDVRALIEEIDDGAIINDDFLEKVEKLLQQGGTTHWHEPFQQLKSHFDRQMAAYDADAAVLEKINQELAKLDDIHAIQMDLFNKDELSPIEAGVQRLQHMLAAQSLIPQKSGVEAQIHFYAQLHDETDPGILLNDALAAQPLLHEEGCFFIGECYGKQLKDLSPDTELDRDMDIVVKPQLEVELTMLVDAIRQHINEVARTNAAALPKTQETLLRVMIYSNQLSTVNVHTHPQTMAELDHLQNRLSRYQALSQSASLPQNVQDAMQAMLLSANHYIRAQEPWANAALNLSQWQPGLAAQARVLTRYYDNQQAEKERQQQAQYRVDMLAVLNAELSRLTQGSKASLLNKWDGNAKVNQLKEVIKRVELGKEPIADLMRAADDVLSTKRFNVFGSLAQTPRSASSFEKLRQKLEQTTLLQQDAAQLKQLHSTANSNASMETAKK